MIDPIHPLDQPLICVWSGEVSTVLRNGTERPIPLNTYFTERLKNKPKQLPTLELVLDGFQVNTTLL